MSNLEHYFENLLFDGKDVNGDWNKNALTKEEQTAVEICADYVLFTLFCGRDDLKEFLKKCEVDEAEPVKMDIERFKKEIADYTNKSGYVDIPLSILLDTLYEVANDKRR